MKYIFFYFLHNSGRNLNVVENNLNKARKISENNFLHSMVVSKVLKKIKILHFHNFLTVTKFLYLCFLDITLV